MSVVRKKTEKITLTLPSVVITQLKELPKGERSGVVAVAVAKELKMRRFKAAVERVQQLEHPVHIAKQRGGWKKPLSLDL